MSSIDRPVSGDVLKFSLGAERKLVNDRAVLESHGRNARTLLKERHLRVTLVMVKAGGLIAKHRAAGPITVQVLEGDIRFRAAGKEHRLNPGDLLAVAAGVEHDVSSEGGGAFLLTLVQPG
jgi:quercetin dioxygenase-like cupin family protein